MQTTHMKTKAELRQANTDKMRRYRGTTEGRDAARRASSKSYHRNKYKAHWRKSKGQPEPLYPPTQHCEICGNRQLHKAMCLDHCHAVGHFRGWLCDLCNKGLGMFRDNPALLRRAASYLETPL